MNALERSVGDLGAVERFSIIDGIAATATKAQVEELSSLSIVANVERLFGGAGNDRLTGGSGKDTISGGTGNDTISARDGVRDLVSCGPGRDVVSPIESMQSNATARPSGGDRELLELRLATHQVADELVQRLAAEHRADPLRDRQLDPEAPGEIAQHRGGGQALDRHSDLADSLVRLGPLRDQLPRATVATGLRPALSLIHI